MKSNAAYLNEGRNAKRRGGFTHSLKKQKTNAHRCDRHQAKQQIKQGEWS